MWIGGRISGACAELFIPLTISFSFPDLSAYGTDLSVSRMFCAQGWGECAGQAAGEGVVLCRWDSGRPTFRESGESGESGAGDFAEAGCVVSVLPRHPLAKAAVLLPWSLITFKWLQKCGSLFLELETRFIFAPFKIS